MDSVAVAGIDCEFLLQYISLLKTGNAFGVNVKSIKIEFVQLDGCSSLFNEAVTFTDLQAAILAVDNYSRTHIFKLHNAAAYVCDVV